VESTTYIFGYNWTNAIPIGAGRYTYNNNLYIIPESVTFQVDSITETTAKIGNYLQASVGKHDSNWWFSAVPRTRYNLLASINCNYLTNIQKWLKACIYDNTTKSDVLCSYFPSQQQTTTFTQTVTAPPPYTFTFTVPERNPFLSLGVPSACTDISNNFEFIGSLYYYQTNDIVIYINYTTQVVIYPNTQACGKYQIACSSLRYCGFKNYVYVFYNKNNGEFALYVVNPSNINDWVTFNAYGGKYIIVQLLSKKVQDFPGVGSLIVWEVEIDSESGSHYKTTVWSVVTSSSETIPQPYPLDVYGTTKLKIYDCGQIGFSGLCPSNNPFFCALWSFFTWLGNTLYKILPQPLQAIFNYLSTFFSIIVSAISIMFNPTLVYLVLVSFTTLLIFYVVGEALDKGVVGVSQAFFNIFDLLKRVVEFIINLIKSIIPF